MDKEIEKMMSPNVKNAYMKLCKASKKELKYIKKRNKILAKKFPDWKDDEFNCDSNKFIFGIKRNNEFEEQPSFYTDNIFEVYYNREPRFSAPRAAFQAGGPCQTARDCAGAGSRP